MQKGSPFARSNLQPKGLKAGRNGTRGAKAKRSDIRIQVFCFMSSSIVMYEMSPEKDTWHGDFLLKMGKFLSMPGDTEAKACRPSSLDAVLFCIFCH